MDESKALKKLKKGDEAALVWFLDRYAPYVRAILSAMLGAEDTEREELASDVFFALWAHRDQVKPGKVKAWLGTVARNRARDRLRQRKPDLPLEEDALTLTCPGPEEAMGQAEEAAFLRSAVLAMEERDRDIFLRHYYLCQTIGAIARALGMNPSTVKTRLRRGREQLKQALKEGGYGDEDQHLRHDGPLGG